MAKQTPRWVQNTLSFIFPIAGAFFIAERKEKERYSSTKTIMLGDIKADWVRIGKTGNPFATNDFSANAFMEQALTGRAAYWVDRFKNAKSQGETRVAARHLAVIDELTRNYTPVEPVKPRTDVKQTADLEITGSDPRFFPVSPSNTSSGFMIMPDGTAPTAPQAPGTPSVQPWYMNAKIMIPVYLGAVALFYFMNKKR
jgi:hypothetical protein